MHRVPGAGFKLYLITLNCERVPAASGKSHKPMFHLVPLATERYLTSYRSERIPFLTLERACIHGQLVVWSCFLSTCILRLDSSSRIPSSFAGTAVLEDTSLSSSQRRGGQTESVIPHVCVSAGGAGSASASQLDAT